MKFALVTAAAAVGLVTNSSVSSFTISSNGKLSFMRKHDSSITITLSSHRVDIDTYQDDIITRAAECADHFGECSIDEMEDLAKKIHSKRITAALTGSDHISAAEETVALEQLLLEEDLELQLSLLKNEMLPNKLSFLVDEAFEEQLLPGDDIDSDDVLQTEYKEMPLDDIAALDALDFIRHGPLGTTSADHLGLKLHSHQNDLSALSVDELSFKSFTPEDHLDLKLYKDSDHSSSLDVAEPSFKSFFNQGVQALMMDERGIPEELVICGAIFLIALMPYILNNHQ